MYTNDLFAKKNGRSSVYSTDGLWEPPKSEAEPGDPALMPASAWAARLPLDVRPENLIRWFGPIAGLLARHWDEPAAARLCFTELLSDRRKNRKAYPPEVRQELLALRQYYFDLQLERVCTRGNTR